MRQTVTDTQMSESTFNFAVYYALDSKKDELNRIEASRKNKISLVISGILGGIAASILISQKVESIKVIEVTAFISLVLFATFRKLIPNKYDKQFQVLRQDQNAINVVLDKDENFSKEHVAMLKRIMDRNGIKEKSISTYYEFKYRE